MSDDYEVLIVEPEPTDKLVEAVTKELIEQDDHICDCSDEERRRYALLAIRAVWAAQSRSIE